MRSPQHEQSGASIRMLAIGDLSTLRADAGDANPHKVYTAPRSCLPPVRTTPRALQAPDEAAVRRIVDDDPAIAVGLMRGELRPFRGFAAARPRVFSPGMTATGLLRPRCSSCSTPSRRARSTRARARPAGNARLPYDDLGFARVDIHRELRQDAPEAVLAEGKTPAEVAAIVTALLDAGAASVMVTRADEAARAAVLEVAPDAREHARARVSLDRARDAADAGARRDRLGRHLGRSGGARGADPRRAARRRRRRPRGRRRRRAAPPRARARGPPRAPTA